jgi:hypothetical protein
MIDTRSNGGEVTMATPDGLRLVKPALQAVHATPIIGAGALISLVAAFWACSVMPLALGVLVSVIVVGVRLLSPRLWRSIADAEASKAVEMPQDSDIADKIGKALLGRLVSARAELDAVLGCRAAARRGAVLVRIQKVRELERAAVAALRRINGLATWLAGSRCAAAMAPIVHDGCAPATARVLERAAAARNEQRAARAALEECRRDELANLEYLTSCLEAIPAGLLELDLLERKARERGLPDPLHEADVLRDELRNVRQEMAHLRA